MTGAIDLRLGRYQDQLEHETWDTAILDLPFSRRTHEGHDAVHQQAGAMFPNKLGYDSIDPDGVASAVDFLAPRTRGWIVSQTSHDLIPSWEKSLARHDRYVFAPIPYVHMGKAPRVVGDGPASWTIFLVVSRPRSKEWLTNWRSERKAQGLRRSLDGAYLHSPGDTVYRPEGGERRMGAKPPLFTRALVRDYSFPCECVCDPTTGHGTTLIAARAEGRPSIGCEVDADAHAVAARRIGLGCTIDMFAGVPPGTDYSATRQNPRVECARSSGYHLRAHGLPEATAEDLDRAPWGSGPDQGLDPPAPREPDDTATAYDVEVSEP